MATYNSYLGVWLLPIHALTLTLEHTTQAYNTELTETTLTFFNAEANSSLEVASLTVPDFNTGGERIVGFTCDLTFIPPYNDYGAMVADFDAIARGRVTNFGLTLKAQDAQPKGAQMEVVPNVWQPISDWSVKPRWVQLELRPAFELLVHGTMSSAMFAIVDALAHRAEFFGTAVEL